MAFGIKMTVLVIYVLPLPFSLEHISNYVVANVSNNHTATWELLVGLWIRRSLTSRTCNEMSELKLIELNNSVVGLRPQVERARVHVIHKMTRQTTSLRNKKVANDLQKSKNLRKADRLTKEVLLLKKLKKHDMAKFALKNTESWMKDIPNNEDQSIDPLLEERALIRIANHPEVKKRVEGFRKKYPDWASSLPKLMEALGKKQQVKDAKMKKLKRQVERAKRKAPLAQPEEPSSGEEVVADSSAEEDADDIANGANNMALDSADGAESGDGAEYESGEETTDSEGYTENFLHQRSGDMEIKTIDMNKASSDEESGMEEGQGKAEASCERTVPQKRDSFFVGGESSSNDEPSDEEDVDSPEFDKNVFANALPRGRGRDGRGRGRGGRGSHQDYYREGYDPQWRGRSRGRGDFGGRGRGRSESRGRGDFRGRGGFGGRGDFRGRGDIRARGDYRGRGRGDRGRDFGRSRGFARDASTSSRGQGEFRGRGREAESNLHPSWAAKRKQSSISEFSGKKIKFDDDGGSAAQTEPRPLQPKKAPAPAGLHPSWAAKKEKQGIQSFAGKKTVFGDDD